MGFPTTLIKAVKGTRDLLPPSTEVWNRVEARGARGFPRLQLPRNPHADPRGDAVVRARRGRRNRHRHQGDVHLRGSRRHFAHAAAGEHRVGDPRLYRAPAGPAARACRSSTTSGPMFRRERPQKGRYRQFFQIGAEAIGSESPVVDAEVIEMVVEILDARRPQRIPSCCSTRWAITNCRPQYVERLREELKRVAPQMCGDCQRRAETNPLRVLDCKVEADQPIIDKLPSILDHLCDAVPRAFRRGEAAIWTTAASPTKCARAWCAAWITTCAPRSKWCTARWARRIRCWAAAATTGWPNRSARRCTAPGIGFSIGEDRLVMSVEGEQPATRRSICSSRRWATRRCGTRRCWRAICGARAIRWSWREGKLKRAMELANKLGARFTLIVGDNEMAAGRYTLKNMATGEQEADARRNRAPARPPPNNERIDMETSVPLDFLGDLRRTHTCGAAARRRRRQDRRPDGLGAPAPRSRRRDLHPPARPRRRHAGGVPRGRRTRPCTDAPNWCGRST